MCCHLKTVYTGMKHRRHLGVQTWPKVTINIKLNGSGGASGQDMHAARSYQKSKPRKESMGPDMADAKEE
jgi:hypothetical protein